MLFTNENDANVKMSHKKRYTWDVFDYIFFHNLKMRKVIEVKICSNTYNIETHILTVKVSP